MNTAKVLGRVEVADLLEVDTRTPHAWFTRKLMPTPDHPAVNGGPAWNRETVVAWAAQTGRLPDSLVDEAMLLGVEIKTDQRGGRKAKAAFGV